MSLACTSQPCKSRICVALRHRLRLACQERDRALLPAPSMRQSALPRSTHRMERLGKSLETSLMKEAMTESS